MKRENFQTQDFERASQNIWALKNQRNPRISIGIPVYNGDNFIEEALKGLLLQTFEDFEIIISDNASTDKTKEICRSYSAQDKRIRYYCNETNIGSAKNHNLVFRLASGEYFKWHAHDDVCTPNFLKTCIQVLDQEPSVILCYPKSVAINENHEILHDFMLKNSYYKLKNTGSKKPHLRFYDLACQRHPCFQIFGLIRSSILGKTALIGSYIGSDRVLLAELSLYGRFHGVPEIIYFRRHSQQFCALNDPKEQMKWFDPNSQQILSRNRKILIEYLNAITRTPLSWHDKVLCYAVLAGNWLKRKHRRFSLKR